MNTNNHLTPKEIEEIVSEFEPSDLDDHVHELKSAEAAEINNSGILEQINYLQEAGGAKWVREVLLVHRGAYCRDQKSLTLRHRRGG